MLLTTSPIFFIIPIPIIKFIEKINNTLMKKYNKSLRILFSYAIIRIKVIKELYATDNEAIFLT